MTWLSYELAKNPDLQARLHAELDAMFAEIGDRDMQYSDCQKLPFLSKARVRPLALPAPPRPFARCVQPPLSPNRRRAACCRVLPRAAAAAGGAGGADARARVCVWGGDARCPHMHSRPQFAATLSSAFARV